MDYETIILKKEEGIATITLNRPEKLNAMNARMTDEIMQARREVEQDKSVRAIILTGAGRGFCSGADLSSHDFQISGPSDGIKLMQEATRMITGIREMPKPIIAAVNGPAVGGGCNLALVCDIIIASETARFGQPYVLRGLHPDFGGTYFLPRMIGFARASDLLLTGRMIDAAEAERMGLVSRVVPGDQLESVAKEIATALAKGPPLAISMIKDSINKSMMMDLPTTLECEAKAQTILWLTEDFKEAVGAFMEKREPVFKGK